MGHKQKARSKGKKAQRRLDQAVLDDGRSENFSAAQLDFFAAQIAAGANPSALTIPLRRGDERVEKKTSALIVASAKGWTDAVALFIRDAELDVNVQDAEGDHALLAAIKVGGRKTAKILLSRSNVALADNQGRSCLASAVESGFASLAKAIVERMSDAEHRREFERMREEVLFENINSSDLVISEIRRSILTLLFRKIEDKLYTLRREYFRELRSESNPRERARQASLESREASAGDKLQ